MTMRHLRAVLVAVFLAFIISGGRPSAQATSPNIKVEGDHFTINGVPTFLIFVSYFDALRAPETAWPTDLAWLSSEGIHGVRIFPNWWHYCPSLVPANDDAVIGPGGNVNIPRFQAMRRFLSAAAQQNMVVDITFTRDTIAPQMTLDQYKSAIAWVVGQIADYENVIVDVQNEWDKGDKDMQAGDITAIIGALKNGDSTRFATASGASTGPPELDFLGARGDRGGFWYTDSVIETGLDALRAGLSAVKPIHLQEPKAFDGGCQDHPQTDLETDNAEFAIKAAKKHGAAGWTFHNRKGMDLTGTTLRAALTGDERDAIEVLSDHAGAQTTWEVAAFSVSPTAIPMPATGGSSAISLARLAGSTANWRASVPPAATWLHLTATQGSGLTDLTVNFNVDANPTFVSRTAKITISGREVTVTQDPATVPLASLGDFDGDVKAEMTLYKPNSADWTILKSTSGYTSSQIVNLGGPGYVPVPGDYDGDGKIDPAVYNSASGQWIALKSSTSYTTTFTQSLGGTGYLPEPGDYDGDGKTDPTVYVQTTGQWIVSKSSTAYATVTFSWGGPGYTAVPGSDFDGDGKSDIAVFRELTGVWSVLKSSSGFTTTLGFTWGGRGNTLVVGDYDGDGKADAGLYHRSAGTWSILKSSTGYTSSQTVSWGGTGYDPAPGDYDGDHKIDLAVVQRSTGNWSILKSTTSYTTVLSVTGWGATGDTIVSSALVPVGSDLTRATDHDADGKAEITIYQSTTGSWLTLNSSTGYTTSTTRGWGGTGYIAAPGDFDGDGKVDLTVYQGTTGNWLVLFSGSGFTTSLTKSAGGAGYMPVVGDYDGDRKSDFGVYNASTGNWFVLKSGENYTTALSINWGGSGYAPAPADFDGDGRTDLGTYQASTGNWYVLLSAANYTSSLSKNAGGPGYTAAAGDYDGDGKADFMTYNVTSGLWTGLKSIGGYTTTLSVSWGGSGYTNVQGDYDGDGKVDLALYQASTGNWLILLSGSVYTTTLNKSWGGAGYVPVPIYP